MGDPEKDTLRWFCHNKVETGTGAAQLSSIGLGLEREAEPKWDTIGFDPQPSHRFAGEIQSHLSDPPSVERKTMLFSSLGLKGSMSVGRLCGCGSKPTGSPFWDFRCTTHFSLLVVGLGCSLGVRFGFDPWPCNLLRTTPYQYPPVEYGSSQDPEMEDLVMHLRGLLGASILCVL